MEKLTFENQQLRGKIYVQQTWKASAHLASAARSVLVARPQAVAQCLPASPNPLVFQFPNARDNAPPASDRLTATVGNLGWNSPSHVLLQRFRDIFDELKIDPSSWRDPLCARDPGSQVSSTFLSAFERRTAEANVRALNKSFPELQDRENKYVWMGRQKRHQNYVSARLRPS